MLGAFTNTLLCLIILLWCGSHYAHFTYEEVIITEVKSLAEEYVTRRAESGFKTKCLQQFPSVTIFCQGTVWRMLRAVPNILVKKINQGRIPVWSYG